MSISHEQVDQFLTRYAATLTDLDAEAAAELWSMPGVIADDRSSGVVESRGAMVDGLKQSYPLYQQLGLGSVTYELLEDKPLTDGLVLVHVRWDFLDAHGDFLIDSTAYYLLRHEPTGLRAALCVQVDDLEKLLALATARGIDLTPSTA
jgi:hypothetical protein